MLLLLALSSREDYLLDNDVKSIFASKTFWVNLITVVVVVLNRKGQVVPPEVIEPLALVVLPFVNMWLRWITKSPVRIGGK